MSNQQKIDLVIFGSKMTILADNVEEMISLSVELDQFLNELEQRYPGAKPTEILAFGCLKIFEDYKKLLSEITDLTQEKNRLNSSLLSVLNNID
jgi:cell division protein ZapA (FtsZ GTPase activity inhibitor)